MGSPMDHLFPETLIAVIHRKSDLACDMLKVCLQMLQPLEDEILYGQRRRGQMVLKDTSILSRHWRETIHDAQKKITEYSPKR